MKPFSAPRFPSPLSSRAALSLGLCLVLAACGGPADQGQGQAPTPTVGVVTIKPQMVALDMALSVLVALILTPALCVTFLRPVEKGHDKHHRGFFGWFNRFFERNTNRYQSAVGRILVRSTRFSLVYLLLVGGMVGLFLILPTSFLPDEDQGVVFTQVQLPPGATQESTVQVLKKVEDHFLNDEGKNVTSVFAVQGFSFGGSGQNSGIAFVMLKDWDQRKAAVQKAKAVADRAMSLKAPCWRCSPSQRPRARRMRLAARGLARISARSRVGRWRSRSSRGSVWRNWCLRAQAKATSRAVNDCRAAGSRARLFAWRSRERSVMSRLPQSWRASTKRA